MRTTTIIAATLLLALALALGAGFMLARQESDVERILRTGSIRVGYAWEPPYAYRDEEGRVTGESPEVARLVLNRLGIRHVEWVRGDFGTLISELRAGRFDLVAAGMFITPERAGLVAFSQPSACIEPALLVRQGNPLKLHSLADIAAHRGAQLAVLNGAVEEQEALAAGVPAERISRFASPDLAVQGIRAGIADALALSGPSIQRLAEQQAGMERVFPFRGPQTHSGCAGFAFRQDDGELARRFDTELQALVGSPTHLELIRPFGFTERNLPPAPR